MDTICPYCGIETGGGSHYHCPRCGRVCSMMGHFEMYGERQERSKWTGQMVRRGLWRPTCKRLYNKLALKVREGVA